MSARAAGVLAALALLPSVARADDFLVASRDRGILRIAPSGAVRAVLSPTHASRAVMGAPGVVVFLVAGTNELRTLEIATHAERIVATLPGDVGLGCGGMWGEPGAPEAPYLLEAAMEEEAAMASDGTRACFELMDRNLNMASVIARLDVDLGSGSVVSHVVLSESCPHLDDAALDADPCTSLFTRRVLSGEMLQTAGRWSVASEGALGVLVGPRRLPLAVREPRIEGTSIDGHWAIVSGNQEEGDYIYRSIWILDQRTGRLYSLVAPESEAVAPARRAWPSSIGRADLADEARMAALGSVISGETSLRWIDARTLLVGETLVVRPGVGTFLLPGRLIR